MALSPKLTARQTQTLALTPSMRQALSILRMSAAELDEFARAEAARNPFLLRAPPPPVAPASTAAQADMEARAAPFQEALSGQVALMGLAAPVAALARLLITELREDGFLDTPLAELVAAWDVSPDDLDTALAALQRCEPAGVGARDLRECLLLQLSDAGLDPAEAAQTVDNLTLFAAGDVAAIARALGLSPRAARRRLALVRALTPRPIAPQEGDSAPPALPDLVLERRPDGTMTLHPAREALAPLYLDEALAARALQDDFARDMLERARALLTALAQRGRTLARIGDWLVEHQAGFLLHGARALRPVTRAAMAQDLGLHPSTVGRAVAGKHIDIDGRLLPLSRLFSAALPSTDGPLSSFTLQQRIAEMIAAESPTAPLSDATIAAVLNAEGVDIARRTVAKYRLQLRVPGSAMRRRKAALAGIRGDARVRHTRP